MEQKFVIDGKIINSTFRRSEFKFIFIYNNMINLVFLFIFNIFFFYLVNPNAPDAYINLFNKHSIFNFVNTSLLFLITSNIYAYYLSIEAKIQFKNRKYYATGEDNFINIFTFPLSFIFSILIALFISFSLIHFSQQINPAFDPVSAITLFLFVFFLTGLVIFFYYYKGIKFLLYKLLSFWNNIASTFKRNLNDEITNSKLYNTNLWLVTIRISNIKEVSKKLKKNFKYIIKAVVRDFSKKARESDYIIPLNYKRGLIGYVLTNDEKVVNMLMSNKIKPYLSNNIVIKDKKLDLVINYKIEDLLKNEEINNTKDIIKLSKSI